MEQELSSCKAEGFWRESGASADERVSNQELIHQGHKLVADTCHGRSRVQTRPALCRGQSPCLGGYVRCSVVRRGDHPTQTRNQSATESNGVVDRTRNMSKVFRVNTSNEG